MKGREGTWWRGVYERNREESKPDRFKVKAEGETHTRWDTRQEREKGRRGDERREGGEERRVGEGEDEGKQQQQHYWQQITKENAELFSPPLPGIVSVRREAAITPEMKFMRLKHIELNWITSSLADGRHNSSSCVSTRHLQEWRKALESVTHGFSTVLLGLRRISLWGEDWTHNLGYSNSKLHQYIIDLAGFLS